MTAKKEAPVIDEPTTQQTLVEVREASLNAVELWLWSEAVAASTVSNVAGADEALGALKRLWHLRTVLEVNS